MSTDTLPGFLRPAKPKQRPISELTVRELNDQRNTNARILASPTTSTSAYVERITAQQHAIEERLTELKDQQNMETIRVGVENTSISADENMNIDVEFSHPKPIGAKQRALMRYGSKITGSNGSSGMTFEEAARIEQEAHAMDKLRHEQHEERRRKQGLLLKGEKLSRQEMELRMWAFMNHKPTDSDMGDDSDSEEDEDPAKWFHDEEDDGIKGQPIVHPDIEDYSGVIRIDERKAYAGYSTFYEPRDGD